MNKYPKEKKNLPMTNARLLEVATAAIKQAIQETKLSKRDIESSSKENGLGSYATKMDAFVQQSIDSLDEMITEGEKLILEDPLKDYAIQERNHMIQVRIGVLKVLRTRFIQILEDSHKNF